MAYGTKYTAGFKTTLGTSIEILFKKVDYASTSTEITLADNPLVIAFGNEDELEVIRPSSAHIRLIGTSFRQYDELCTGGNRDWQVEILADSSTIWQGYIVPSQYIEPYTHSTYVLNIIASDGLEGLKDVQYLDSGDRYIGLEDLRTIIDNCFSIGNIDLTLLEALMTYEDSQTSTLESDPLSQTQIYQEHFYDESTNEVWNCWDVITEILRPFKAILTMLVNDIVGTSFIIIEPENMLNDSMYLRARIAGVNYSYAIDTSVSLGANLVLANDDMMLKYGDQYNKAIVNFDTGVLDNVLKNGDFIEEKWSSATQPLYWTKVNSADVSRDGNAVVLTDPVAAGTARYIQTRIYECWSGVKSAKLSFVYLPTWTGSLGSAFYALVDDSGNFYKPSTETWDGVAPSLISYDYSSGVEATFELDFENIPSGGSGTYIELRLYELNTDAGVAGTIKFSNVKLELTYDTTINYARYIKETLTVEEDSNTDTLNIPSEYEIKCGDTGSNLTTRGIATGGFFDGSGNYTSKWKIKGNDYIDNPVNIQQLLAWKIALQHSKQFDILEGSIRNCDSLYYPYPTLLSDPNNINEYGIARKYFPYYMEWNVKDEQSNGYWKELLYGLGSELLTSWAVTVGYDYWDDFSETDNEIDLAVADPDNDNRANSNSIAVVDGTKYLILFTLSDDGVGNLPVFKLGTQNLTVAWGENNISIEASTTGNVTLNIQVDNYASDFSVTGVSVKQITGY